MLAEKGNPTEGYIFTSQTKGKGDQLTTRSVNDAMKALAVKTFGKEKAKQFKTKTLRSFYNSALLRAKIQPQELKDVMMGHGRKGARKHYDYDEYTIKEAYKAAFEHLSINGIQSREDLAEMRNQLSRFDQQNKTLLEMLTEMREDNKEVKQQLKDQSKKLEILEMKYRALQKKPDITDVKEVNPESEET
jgi:predicted RNase H-like nuclease (RuvC/YqgF family)